MTERGNLFVIAAPSGTGKTTLVKALIDTVPKLSVSISHTTRPKRTNEMHGINYYFIEPAEFEAMIKQNDFLEYATIFEHQYGTSKTWVNQTLDKSIDVILEIDWQGYQQIKKLLPDTVGIFILPPSLADLSERLLKRNQDHPGMIKKRLSDAQATVSHIDEFDYVVINDDFDNALRDLKIIIEAERLRRTRQSLKYAKLIEDLTSLKAS